MGLTKKTDKCEKNAFDEPLCKTAKCKVHYHLISLPL